MQIGPSPPQPGWVTAAFGAPYTERYVDQLGSSPVVTCQWVTWEKRHQFWAWQTRPTTLSKLCGQALPGDLSSLSLSVLAFKMGTSLSFQRCLVVSGLEMMP